MTARTAKSGQVAIFLVLILVLLIKPAGLLGKKSVVKV